VALLNEGLSDEARHQGLVAVAGDAEFGPRLHLQLVVKACADDLCVCPALDLPITLQDRVVLLYAGRRLVCLRQPEQSA
jgi:hypothetical protein